MTRMFVVFDLDGTLADCTHRLHYIDGSWPTKDWPAFFKACVRDEPIYPMIELLGALYWSGQDIEIWSGRSDMVRAETEAWLARYVPSGIPLRMRADGDYRADQIVKAEWLDALDQRPLLDRRPTLVFDDRQRVVDMWRAHGIRCCQVAPGDF